MSTCKVGRSGISTFHDPLGLLGRAWVAVLINLFGDTVPAAFVAGCCGALAGETDEVLLDKVVRCCVGNHDVVCTHSLSSEAGP